MKINGRTILQFERYLLLINWMAEFEICRQDRVGMQNAWSHTSIYARTSHSHSGRRGFWNNSSKQKAKARKRHVSPPSQNFIRSGIVSCMHVRLQTQINAWGLAVNHTNSNHKRRVWVKIRIIAIFQYFSEIANRTCRIVLGAWPGLTIGPSNADEWKLCLLFCATFGCYSSILVPVSMSAQTPSQNATTGTMPLTSLHTESMFCLRYFAAFGAFGIPYTWRGQAWQCHGSSRKSRILSLHTNCFSNVQHRQKKQCQQSST